MSRNLGAIATAYMNAERHLNSFLHEIRILEDRAEEAKETLDEIGHGILVAQAVNLLEKCQSISAEGSALAHSLQTEVRMAIDRMGA
jgi:hypothetical protein